MVTSLLSEKITISESRSQVPGDDADSLHLPQRPLHGHGRPQPSNRSRSHASHVANRCFVTARSAPGSIAAMLCRIESIRSRRRSASRGVRGCSRSASLAAWPWLAAAGPPRLIWRRPGRSAQRSPQQWYQDRIVRQGPYNPVRVQGIALRPGRAKRTWNSCSPPAVNAAQEPAR